MAATILDPDLEERLIAERKATGLDRYDEVWDGVYIMSPWPKDQHQKIAGFLNAIFEILIGLTGHGETRQGINLSDRPEDWIKNFRVPDVVVFLKDGAGICHESFWTGGPDFAVEVISEGEDPEAKFEFYGGLNTRELLLVDRDPWRLQLYFPQSQTMQLAQSSEIGGPSIRSAVLGLMFRLQDLNADELEFIVEHPDGRSWKRTFAKEQDA
jgi:Uma2 family endonuclease